MSIAGLLIWSVKGTGLCCWLSWVWQSLLKTPQSGTSMSSMRTSSYFLISIASCCRHLYT